MIQLSLVFSLRGLPHEFGSTDDFKHNGSFQKSFIFIEFHRLKNIISRKLGKKYLKGSMQINASHILSISEDKIQTMYIHRAAQ